MRSSCIHAFMLGFPNLQVAKHRSSDSFKDKLDCTYRGCTDWTGRHHRPPPGTSSYDSCQLDKRHLHSERLSSLSVCALLSQSRMSSSMTRLSPNCSSDSRQGTVVHCMSACCSERDMPFRWSALSAHFASEFARLHRMIASTD